MTRHILKRLSPDARLVAIDNNDRFVEHLGQSCRDRRLIPVCADAQELAAVLDRFELPRVDAVVSSLGLTVMASDQRTSIVRQVTKCLGPSGVMTQYQYLLSGLRCRDFSEKRFLEMHFGRVRKRCVLRNLPPATVFVCHR